MESVVPCSQGVIHSTCSTSPSWAADRLGSLLPCGRRGTAGLYCWSSISLTARWTTSTCRGCSLPTQRRSPWRGHHVVCEHRCRSRGEVPAHGRGRGPDSPVVDER